MKAHLTAVFAAQAFAGMCASLAVPPPPPPEFADTETSTNMVFDSGSVHQDRFTFALDLFAEAGNNAQIAFGVEHGSCHCARNLRASGDG